MNRRGFTLIELLLAVAILSIVMAIVYASFITVVNSSAAVQVAAEELRLRTFLSETLSVNLSSIKATDDPTYAFYGVNNDGADGPLDAMRFVSSTPLLGGMAMPGDVKEVRVEAIDRREAESLLNFAEDEAAAEGPPVVMRVTETPLSAGNVQELTAEDGYFKADANYEAPSWTAPVQTLDIEYFDGEEWVEEWDSEVYRRMPWCVRFRINFWRTEAERQHEQRDGINMRDDPDFELVVPIPAGIGVLEEQPPLADVMALGAGAMPGGRAGERQQDGDDRRDGTAPNQRGGSQGGLGGIRGLGSSTGLGGTR